MFSVFLSIVKPSSQGLGLFLLLTSLANAATAADPVSTQKGTVLVFGDSISAAYGMTLDEGWVNLLAERLARDAPGYSVVNASVSGETSGGGLVRLPKTLALHQPHVVILELGGNDGLRGYPISKISDNLMQMTQLAMDSGARVLLVGMVLPPNYGRRYTSAFERLFEDVAASTGSALVPVLLNGVATSESLMQRDGIHPKPEAQQLLLDDIWPQLASMLTPGEALAVN